MWRWLGGQQIIWPRKKLNNSQSTFLRKTCLAWKTWDLQFNHSQWFLGDIVFSVITCSYEVGTVIQKHRPHDQQERQCQHWFQRQWQSHMPSFPRCALHSYTSSVEWGSPFMGGSTGSIRPGMEKNWIFIENAASQRQRTQLHPMWEEMLGLYQAKMNGRRWHRGIVNPIQVNFFPFLINAIRTDCSVKPASTTTPAKCFFKQF